MIQRSSGLAGNFFSLFWNSPYPFSPIHAERQQELQNHIGQDGNPIPEMHWLWELGQVNIFSCFSICQVEKESFCLNLSLLPVCQGRTCYQGEYARREEYGSGYMTKKLKAKEDSAVKWTPSCRDVAKWLERHPHTKGLWVRSPALQGHRERKSINMSH